MTAILPHRNVPMAHKPAISLIKGSQLYGAAGWQYADGEESASFCKRNKISAQYASDIDDHVLIAAVRQWRGVESASRR